MSPSNVPGMTSVFISVMKEDMVSSLGTHSEADMTSVFVRTREEGMASLLVIPNKEDLAC